MGTVKVKRERFGPFRKPTQPIVPESSKYIDTQPKIAQLPIVRRKQSVGNFCLPVRVAFRSLAMGSSLSQVRTKRDRGIFLCTRHKGDSYAASCMKKHISKYSKTKITISRKFTYARILWDCWIPLTIISLRNIYILYFIIPFVAHKSFNSFVARK